MSLASSSSFIGEDPLAAVHASHKKTGEEEPEEPWYTQPLNSVIYGIINTIACVPVLYGYAQIVFSQDIYQAYMPMLAKLFIFSSVVHQAVFSLFSSLPYAVGQVQDAG